MSRNIYDDAYLMGYHNGYHDVGYLNPYHKHGTPQYHIKYLNGHKDGCSLKRDEEFTELLEEEVARNNEWITMYNTKERV
jgi:hypothetical protein